MIAITDVMIEIEVFNKNLHRNYRVIGQDGIMKQITSGCREAKTAPKT